MILIFIFPATVFVVFLLATKDWFSSGIAWMITLLVGTVLCSVVPAQTERIVEHYHYIDSPSLITVSKGGRTLSYYAVQKVNADSSTNLVLLDAGATVLKKGQKVVIRGFNRPKKNWFNRLFDCGHYNLDEKIKIFHP